MEVKHGIISIHPHREQMKQKLKAFSLCISVPIANCFTAQFGQDLSSTSIAFSFPFYYTTILAVTATQGAGRGAEGITSFLLVLTGGSPW
jgi:hypothetical protein